MLLTSDEAALFLLARTAMLWLDALPPGQIKSRQPAALPSANTSTRKVDCTTTAIATTFRILVVT